MYHGIGLADCHRVNVRHIAQQVFDHHLSLFKEHFHVVRLADLFAGERHPSKLTVALTFDDGLRNNRSHALPIMEKHGVPATFFITGGPHAGLRILWGDLLDLGERHTDQVLHVSGTTWKKNARGHYAGPDGGLLLRDHIKRRGVWAPKQELYDQLLPLMHGPLQVDKLFWELMTDEELVEFARHPLVDLGSHGWWHNDMGRIPINEVRDELMRSREHLSMITGKNIRCLAWPSGSWSTASAAAASELGLSQQLGVDALAGAKAQGSTQLLTRYGVYDFPVRDRWLLALIAREAHS